MPTLFQKTTRIRARSFLHLAASTKLLLHTLIVSSAQGSESIHEPLIARCKHSTSGAPPASPTVCVLDTGIARSSLTTSSHALPPPPSEFPPIFHQLPPIQQTLINQFQHNPHDPIKWRPIRSLALTNNTGSGRAAFHKLNHTGGAGPSKPADMLQGPRA